MENENKPVKDSAEKKNNRRGHHGKHNKSRGYFITPPQSQEQKKESTPPKKPEPEQKPKMAQQPTPAPAPNNAGSERKSGGRNNRRRRGHGGHHAQKPNAQQQVQKQQLHNTPIADEATAKVTTATDGNNRQKTSRHTTRQNNHSSVTLREHLDDPKDMMAEPIEEETLDPSLISPDVLETPPSMPVVDDTVARVEVVGIRFKASGKIYYFDPAGKSYSRGNYAIVETARGLEYGEIALANTSVKETDVVPPLRPILREATNADTARHEENKKKEADALVLCAKKIAEHKLDMKLIEAQYTFDNSKLLFYFTSEGRVDFRELVKDLASVFRTRIELRQIGIRDEAKMMGGLGLCGRPLCCSVFLSDFCQVSIKMAKEQNFSLNSSKISGMCGRLMCCLRFEHETYEYEIKRTPPVDSVVQTPDGNGVVIENSPLAGTVKVRLSVTPEVAPKIYHRDDVIVLQKKQSNPNNDKSGNKKTEK